MSVSSLTKHEGIHPFIFMEDQETVPKGNISQMDVDIGKQIEKDAKDSEEKSKQEEIKKEEELQKKITEKAKRKKIPFLKRIFKRRKSAGPMGVTDISKKPVRINLSEDIKKLFWIILECIIIGILISIFASNFGMKMSIMDCVGWMICWWLVKFKMPDIVRSYRK